METEQICKTSDVYLCVDEFNHNRLIYVSLVGPDPKETRWVLDNFKQVTKISRDEADTKYPGILAESVEELMLKQEIANRSTLVDIKTSAIQLNPVKTDADTKETVFFNKKDRTIREKLWTLIGGLEKKLEYSEDLHTQLDQWAVTDSLPVENIYAKLKETYSNIIPAETPDEAYTKALKFLEEHLTDYELEMIDPFMLKNQFRAVLPTSIDYVAAMKSPRKPSITLYAKYAFYTSPNIVQIGTGKAISSHSFEPIYADNVLLSHSHINKIHFICALATDKSSTNIDAELIYKEELFKRTANELNKDPSIIPTIKINTVNIKVANIPVGEEYLWLYAHRDTVATDKRFVDFSTVERDIDPTKFYWAPTYLSYLHPVNSLMNVNNLEGLIHDQTSENSTAVSQWKKDITEEIRKGLSVNPPTPKEILDDAVKALGEDICISKKYD